MAKHTQTIHRLLPKNCLSVFDHFGGLTLNKLKQKANSISPSHYITLKLREEIHLAVIRKGYSWTLPRVDALGIAGKELR